MAGSNNAASPGSPRTMTDSATSPPLQPNSPTAREQAAATPGPQTLDVDMSTSREEGGAQQGEGAGDVDIPASEPGHAGEEDEEEEFRYDTVGQASGDASFEPQALYSEGVRMTSLSPTTSTGSPHSPQSSKSPYSKWDPRHEEYARTTSATAASGPSEVSPSLETPPAPDWSSASSPVMVSVPSSPITNIHTTTRGETKPAQTSGVDALRERTRNVLKDLSPWLLETSQPTLAPAKMSTAQSAIKAVEARMQKPVQSEPPTPEPRPAPPAVHSPPQLVPAHTDKTKTSSPHPSIPASTLPTQSSPSTEADAVIPKLKRELEAAEKRSQQLETGLRNERSARAKAEEERNRLKSIAISLRRSGEQTGEDKRAREAAEAEVARLRNSLQERDNELEQTRAALASCEKDVERLEVERTEAIRDIVRTEDELHGRIVEDGTELISLREQVVALLVGQTELQEEVDQLTEERDSFVARVKEASDDFQRLKVAMIRMRANHEAQLEAKEEELAAARQAAEHARAESSDISALPAKLQWLIREADSATKALRRHLDAVMPDLGPVARQADDDDTGVLSKSSLLQLVDRADTIFATRAALVLPHPFNASLSTAEWEHGETPLQQLNKLQSRYSQLHCRHEEAEKANARLMGENARLRKESVAMHKAVMEAHKLIEEYSGLYA